MNNPNVNAATYSILKKHGFLNNDGQLKLDINKGYAVEKYLKSIVPTKRNDAIIYLNKLYDNYNSDKKTSEKIEKTISEEAITANKGKAKENIDNKDYIENKKLGLISELEKYTKVKSILDKIYKNFDTKSEEIYTKGIDIKIKIDELYKEELNLGKTEHKDHMKKVLKELTNGDNLDLIKDLVPEEFISEDALKDEIDKLVKDKKDREKAKELDAIREKSQILKKEQEAKEAKEKEDKYKLENAKKIEEYKTTYNEFDKMVKDIKMYIEKGSGKITPTDIGHMEKRYKTYNTKINDFKSPDSTTINVDDKNHGLTELKDWKNKLKEFYDDYEKLYRVKVLDAPIELTAEEKKIIKEKEDIDVAIKIKVLDSIIEKLDKAYTSNYLIKENQKKIDLDKNLYNKILSKKENYAEFITLYDDFVGPRMFQRKQEFGKRGYKLDI